MRKIETYLVDSFTSESFKGNPAGVCLLNEPLNENEMQAIASELGFSETAFIHKKEAGYKIRYFSPKMEIPLCGHATLAGSKVLFNKNHALNNIHFHTIENLTLNIRKRDNLIEMSFPVYPITPATPSKALLGALDILEYTNCAHNKETEILMIEIEDVHSLRNLTPDFNALLKAPEKINGVLITALSQQKEFDFESRYFWPWSGTNEDPVTGGTHTFLAKYWSDKLNKKTLNSFQCSHRTGFMQVEIQSKDTLLIRSQAQIIFEGQLYLN